MRGARTLIHAHNSGTTCLRAYVPSQKMILSAWPIIPIILSVRSCYTLYIYIWVRYPTLFAVSENATAFRNHMCRRNIFFYYLVFSKFESCKCFDAELFFTPLMASLRCSSVSLMRKGVLCNLMSGILVSIEGFCILNLNLFKFTFGKIYHPSNDTCFLSLLSTVPFLYSISLIVLAPPSWVILFAFLQGVEL